MVGPFESGCGRGGPESLTNGMAVGTPAEPPEGLPNRLDLPLRGGERPRSGFLPSLKNVQLQRNIGHSFPVKLSPNTVDGSTL